MRLFESTRNKFENKKMCVDVEEGEKQSLSFVEVYFFL